MSVKIVMEKRNMRLDALRERGFGKMGAVFALAASAEAGDSSPFAFRSPTN
jgi:hypothetical protein